MSTTILELKNKKIEVIFIDLDGPILNGKWKHYTCYYDIVSMADGAPVEIEDYWFNKRNLERRNDLLARSKYNLEYSVYLENWISKIEQKEYLRLDVLQPKAIEALSILKNKCQRLILVTRRRDRDNLINQLKQLEVYNFFSQIINCPFGDLDVKYNAVKHIHFADAIFIGDTEDDTEAAKKLGITSIAVTCGLRDKKYICADYYYDELINFAYAII